MVAKKKASSAVDAGDDLIVRLKRRFAEHQSRHHGLDWKNVERASMRAFSPS